MKGIVKFFLMLWPCITIEVTENKREEALEHTSYSNNQSTYLTNSTLHIGSVVIHDVNDVTANTTCKSPIFYRYIITLTQPQLIIFVTVLCIGVLIFVAIIINLIIFSYSHQQSQSDLMIHLTNIATELEGITAKASQRNAGPSAAIRRPRPMSFAALPSLSLRESSSYSVSQGIIEPKKHSGKCLKRMRSKSMATILEV